MDGHRRPGACCRFGEHGCLCNQGMCCRKLLDNQTSDGHPNSRNHSILPLYTFIYNASHLGPTTRHNSPLSLRASRFAVLWNGEVCRICRAWWERWLAEAFRRRGQTRCSSRRAFGHDANAPPILIAMRTHSAIYSLSRLQFLPALVRNTSAKQAIHWLAICNLLDKRTCKLNMTCDYSVQTDLILLSGGHTRSTYLCSPYSPARSKTLAQLPRQSLPCMSGFVPAPQLKFTIMIFTHISLKANSLLWVLIWKLRSIISIGYQLLKACW